MLKRYIVKSEMLRQADDEARDTEIVWYDLVEPTREEEVRVEQVLGIEVPTREEMHEIELSSRLYFEKAAAYVTITVVTRGDSDSPEIHNISFILSRNTLVTIRYVNTMPFDMFLSRKERVAREHYHGSSVFAGLFEALVDRLSDVLEKTGHHIDEVSREIFLPHEKKQKRLGQRKLDFEKLLKEVGRTGDLISKARESLFSFQRAISFVGQTDYFKNAEDGQRLQVLARDIVALGDHAAFLSQKVNFLLDATLGMVSIEQNSIIKIFSVAAVVFLPPTLVASIYGMNFNAMPELSWKFGYPLALLIMLLSAYLPYKFFRHKGWL